MMLTTHTSLVQITLTNFFQKCPHVSEQDTASFWREIIIFFRSQFSFQDQISLDPVNYSLLSLVFPSFKLPSNPLDHKISLKILVALVTTTNIILMMSLSIIYVLYQTDKYNPWCHEDLSELIFEEEIFPSCFWFIFLLFLAASLPTIVVYSAKFFRYA